MDRNDLLVESSNGKDPEPCSDYDKETGYCKSFGKPCDACYENSLKKLFYYY